MSIVEVLAGDKVVERVSASFLALEQMIEEIPSYRDFINQVLLDELDRVAPRNYIKNIFLNARQPNATRYEPTGLLPDVLIECLAIGRTASYDSNEYGLFWRDSSHDSDLIAELAGVDIGLLINDIVRTLAQRYNAILSRYWTMASGVIVAGVKTPARRILLRDAYAELFWSEMYATARKQGFTSEVEESLNVFVKNQPQAPAYSVALQLETGEFAVLDCCFVLRLNGQFDSELRPTNDGWTLLYTPHGGLEVFGTSASLQNALEQRLSSADSRAQLLGGMAAADASNVAAVPQIRYQQTSGELFQFCVDNLLVKQQRDLGLHLERLQTPGGNRLKVIESVKSVLQLSGVSSDGRARMLKLLEQSARVARPQWLLSASSTNQEIFESLERELLRSQVAWHGAMGGLSSFHEYARGVVAEHVSSGQTDPADPDSIWVSVRSVVPLGSKKIEHVERKTLTQLFMYGVHDDRRPYSIQLDAVHDNPRLTPSNIEFAIRHFDLRLKFAQEHAERLNSSQVREAMRELLSQQIALSNFAAILQKHISPSAQNVVQRYLNGDPSMEASSVAFRKSYLPMKDMVVFRAKAPVAELTLHVLYAPGAPTGQQWYEFPDLNGLKKHFTGWGFEPQGRDFLIAQHHGVNRTALVRSYLSLTESRRVFETWWWNGITLVPWTQAPLIDAVQNLIDWEIAEEQVVTPEWYRKAAAGDRERFTRLNTEFKAIAQVAKEPLYIQTLTQFSRQSVMQALNNYLSRFRGHPEIDPDRVHVKLRGHDYMTLTHLFIQWQIWKPDEPVSFFSLDHTSLGELNTSVVSALIGLRPGVAYEQYLREQFVDSVEKEHKAKLYCKTVQNEMFRAALTQKMQGTLSTERYNWLNEQIADLDHDRVSTADPVYRGIEPGRGIYTLSLEGCRLEGAYSFGRDVAGRLEFLVYIPKAPDGLAFRPIESLTKDLGMYALGDHVVRLVRLEDQSVMQYFVNRCRAAIDAPLATPWLRDSFPVVHFRQEYQSMVQRLLYDLDHQTVTQAELFWRHVLIGVELLVDVISLFVPPVGLAASIVRITRSIVWGVIAYNRGDETAGKAHLASAWTSAIVLYVGFVSGVGTSSSAVGLLGHIKDLSEIVSTLTGVQVGTGFATSVVTPLVIQQGETRIVY